MFWKKKFSLRFTRQLLLLLESGLATHVALRLMSYSQRSQKTRRIVEAILYEVEAGQSLSTALRWRGAFTPGYVAAIEWAEDSGRLDDMLIVLRLLSDEHEPLPRKDQTSLINEIENWDLTSRSHRR